MKQTVYWIFIFHLFFYFSAISSHSHLPSRKPWENKAGEVM